MHQNYGVDTLIKSFSLLYKKYPNIRLKIIGSGQEKKNLVDLVKHLAIEELVEFIPKVDHSQVPIELNKMDIFVALSNFESFGVAIIEANACGLPVVVSDTDGPAEVVVQNKTGLVVPKNNPVASAKAIELLINDKKLREKLGLEGRLHVKEHYMWDSCVDKLIGVYKELYE